ncbi:hypothetical protein M5K25_012012 [Dendrobium thyrsiflorum]|uniref:Uncharacterized protein n=1 Tax=Dendrobium thyrsiflorum TaxID=117978 RepID=A0ABD0VBC7_DENTH
MVLEVFSKPCTGNPISDLYSKLRLLKEGIKSNSWASSRNIQTHLDVLHSSHPLAAWLKLQYISPWKPVNPQSSPFWKELCKVAADARNAFHFSLTTTSPLSFYWDPWCRGHSVANMLQGHFAGHNAEVQEFICSGNWALPVNLPDAIADMIKTIHINASPGPCLLWNNLKWKFWLVTSFTLHVVALQLMVIVFCSLALLCLAEFVYPVQRNLLLGRKKRERNGGERYLERQVREVWRLDCNVDDGGENCELGGRKLRKTNERRDAEQSKLKQRAIKEKPFSSFFFFSPLALWGLAFPALGAMKNCFFNFPAWWSVSRWEWQWEKSGLRSSHMGIRRGS